MSRSSPSYSRSPSSYSPSYRSYKPCSALRYRSYKPSSSPRYPSIKSNYLLSSPSSRASPMKCRSKPYGRYASSPSWMRNYMNMMKLFENKMKRYGTNMRSIHHSEMNKMKSSRP